MTHVLQNILIKLCLVYFNTGCPEDDEFRPKHVGLYDYFKKIYS
jgi:hypothetical protein